MARQTDAQFNAWVNRINNVALPRLRVSELIWIIRADERDNADFSMTPTNKAEQKRAKDAERELVRRIRLGKVKR